jgi:L-fuculose-phosphate aldolase
MTPASLVIADADGNKVAGEGKVTSEFFTHLAAYEQRPDIEAVVHAHPPMATALTMAGLDMRAPLLPEVVMALGAVPCAPYSTPGSREGADAIRGLIREGDAVLLDRHGAVTVGADLLDAYYKMEKLEHAAHIILAAHGLGTPRLLSQEAIDKVLAARDAYGARGKVVPPSSAG